jgi:sensor histidine kinase regulating citrate/malate metabolism
MRVIMLIGNIARNAIDSFVGGSDAGTIVTSIIIVDEQ